MKCLVKKGVWGMMIKKREKKNRNVDSPQVLFIFNDQAFKGGLWAWVNRVSCILYKLPRGE